MCRAYCIRMKEKGVSMSTLVVPECLEKYCWPRAKMPTMLDRLFKAFVASLMIQLVPPFLHVDLIWWKTSIKYYCQRFSFFLFYLILLDFTQNTWNKHLIFPSKIKYRSETQSISFCKTRVPATVTNNSWLPHWLYLKSQMRILFSKF